MDFSDSAVAAQASAIQRFSTQAGWNQMGNWLKTAEMNKDYNRLKLLLSQCAQAQLTVELLQSNDTPKFIRRLSKSCLDSDIRRAAGDLVIRWKKLIAEPPKQNLLRGTKKTGLVKRKTSSSTVGISSNDGSKVKVAKVASDQRLNSGKQENGHDSEQQTSDSGDASSTSKSSNVAEKTDKAAVGTTVAQKPAMAATTSSKLTEFNLFEKLDEERNKEKKKRPKTVKTYMSKFRSTGELHCLGVFMDCLRVLFC
uniref:TFIIS N-terminal domain-containing protein n=1 Tax=Syphacia muris TaxID=451379 RepID=A0A0N5AU40_9BILA